MTRLRIASLLLVFCAAAACTPAEEEGIDEALFDDGAAVDLAEAPIPDEGAIPEQCDADLWRGLIGQPFAAVTLPEGPKLRAYGATDIVTQDYLPDRTNVVYDGTGTITRVFCG